MFVEKEQVPDDKKGPLVTEELEDVAKYTLRARFRIAGLGHVIILAGTCKLQVLRGTL